MGKKKYNGFYFIEDGKVHPDSDYWDLYNKNKNEATKNEVKEFCESATDEDIKNRLTICMNKMLKQKTKEKSKNSELTVKKDNNEFEAFIIKNKEEKKKYLPTISLYSQHIREELDRLKIYYGKCKVYYRIYTNKNEEIKRYYLQVLNNKTNKLICSLSTSLAVFGYLKYANLPNENENYKEYYLCFFAEFNIKKGYLNANLKDSRMILFKEIENN